MDTQKVVCFGMAAVCAAFALYCADRAGAYGSQDHGVVGMITAVLVPLWIIMAFMEGGNGMGSQTVHTEVHVHNQQPQAPQIIVLQAEPQAVLSPPSGVTREDVRQIVAELQAQQAAQLPPPAHAVRIEPPAHRPMEIEAEFRTLTPLPSGKPEQPLRLAGPRKSIADRVAVALLAGPKLKDRS